MQKKTDHRAPTALVFGASGQIGTALLPLLHEAGWQVLAVSRQSRCDQPWLQWLRGDLDTPPPLPEAVDVVFSCGPLDAFARWYGHCTLQCRQLVAFSSTSVMVKRDSQDLQERELAARLAHAEQLLFARGQQQATAVTILRPTLIWGAGMDRSLSRIAGMALRWKLFVLPCSARGGRQPVHVQDLATAAIRVLDCPGSNGSAYALGGGEVLPYRQMVKRVLAVLPGRPPLLCLPDRLFALLVAVARRTIGLSGFGPAVQARMSQDLVFDIAPAQRDFGYAPRGFQPQPGELGLDQ